MTTTTLTEADFILSAEGGVSDNGTNLPHFYASKNAHVVLKRAMGTEHELEACENFSLQLSHRLPGCVESSLMELYKADFLAGRTLPGLGNLDPKYSFGAFAHTRATQAARAVRRAFPDRISLAREQAITDALGEERDNLTGRTEITAVVARIAALFTDGTITSNGGRFTMAVNDEVPQVVLTGRSVTFDVPNTTDTPVVLKVRSASQSESDGTFITVGTPGDTVIGDKTVSFAHLNEAVYKVERASSETGQPNTFVFRKKTINRVASIGHATYNSLATDYTLQPGDLSYTFEGVDITITRTETDVEEDE